VIDDALRAFLRDYVPSFWAMELMMLMSSDPARDWTAEQLTAELRASLALVNDLLAQFESKGLIAQTSARGNHPLYRWRPESAELDATARGAIQAYQTTPRQVLRMILDTPSDRIRTFADAFRFKKDDKPS
jgi:hypothetical protein